MNQVPTVADTKDLLKTVLDAVEAKGEDTRYSFLVNWKIGATEALSLEELKTVLRHLKEACAILKQDFQSLMELKITQDDVAGRKIKEGVHEILQARAALSAPEKEIVRPTLVVPESAVAEPAKQE